jgi:hypothetical protein
VAWSTAQARRTRNKGGHPSLNTHFAPISYAARRISGAQSGEEIPDLIRDRRSRIESRGHLGENDFAVAFFSLALALACYRTVLWVCTHRGTGNAKVRAPGHSTLASRFKAR